MKMTNTEEIIIRLLRTGPKKWRELEEASSREDVKRSTFHYNLKKLIRKGLVRKDVAEDGSSLYSMTRAPIEKNKLAGFCLSMLKHEDADRRLLGLKLLERLLASVGVWNERMENFYKEEVLSNPNKFPEALKEILRFTVSAYKVGPNIERFLRENATRLQSIVEDETVNLELRKKLFSSLVKLRLLKGPDEREWIFKLFRGDEFSDLHDNIKEIIFTIYKHHGFEVLKFLNDLLEVGGARERSKEALDYLIGNI